MSLAARNIAEGQILDAARTALIDGSFDSDARLRPRFVSNDRSKGTKVLADIERELASCDEFVFSVAFVTQSGIQPLKQIFRELEDRDIPGRILTTDYLAFSEPAALAWLSARSNIEVRMFTTGEVGGQKSEGFHTKGYLFRHADGTHSVYVGSSNLTAAALIVNREWNTKFTSTEDGELFNSISDELEHLWSSAAPLEGVLETYERIYAAKKQVIAQQQVVPIEQVRLEPNSMQLEFVHRMSELIEAGETRALLVSATGTGKTYASAFALRDERPQRMLFLAHREQILKQAMRSYSRVFGPTKTLGLLSGNSHETDAEYLFATMQTMSRDEVLQSFAPDAFDTIVIDEVHRAGAPSYQKIIEHFDAQMILGMTASPDRPDGFDIYRLFDNNIASEIRLERALENDLLCPFHYFGITDIAFEGLEEGEELRDFSRLVEDRRVDYILRQSKFYGFSGDRIRGLVFCSTNKEAWALSTEFNRRGYRTLALSGENSQAEREAASDRLAAKPGDGIEPLDFIFSVDIFNEGIDIPQVNQVIMLRPTESPIIFVQQLGRGLRKADGKEFVVILDFIGNYANNYMIPIALSGDRSYSKDAIRRYVMEGNRVIPGCSSIHFDEISRQRIFSSIDRSSTSLRMLKEKYLLLKHKLGRIPEMVDFLEHGEVDPMLFIDKKGSYHGFLKWADKDYTREFSRDEELVLEFLSSFIANGMRPHELLMLRELCRGEKLDEREFASELWDYCALELEDGDFDSAVRMLGCGFVNAPGDKKKYGDLVILDIEDDGATSISSSLEDMLRDEVFAQAVQEIVSFGLKRYELKYSGADHGLKLYQKYTRKDVCRLLNWERDDSSTMYGYRVKYGTCPIFVTYNKQEGISSSTQYEDRFLSPRQFSWMTRSRLTLESNEVKQIISAKETGLDVRLFVKKSDDEGSDFYYMGRVDPVEWRQTTIRDDGGKDLPIVNFTFKLLTPVREDYYEYLAG